MSDKIDENWRSDAGLVIYSSLTFYFTAIVSHRFLVSSDMKVQVSESLSGMKKVVVKHV